MPENKKKKSKIRSYIITGFKIVIVSLFYLSLPGINIYQPPPIYSKPITNIQFPTPALYPQNVANLPVPRISSEGVLIVDLASQKVLFEKNSRQKFPPASTTKIVTALVAFEYFKPEQILEVKKPLVEGRVMGLISGERISAENLIYGALVHSANDAAFTLAENYPGGENAFVDKMNEKIKQLGLTDTHFTNPVGFENPNHYTSPYDLAQLSRLALANEKIKKIIATKLISVSDESYSIFHTLENVNLLLGKVPGVAGVKTGYTPEAGEVLSTIVKRGDNEVLIVVLKSSDRFGETEALINWVFNNYKWINLQPTDSTTPAL